MRSLPKLLAFVGALVSTGCAIHQTGPSRPITIDDDVAMMRGLAQPEDIGGFYRYGADQQANIRNQVVTARMYIADLEYHAYEARLTKDIEEEGLAATLASLGLTTSSTLVAPAATKTILSGIATGVTGADKAFNEKVLLSNTIQALQTQMRADRKEQAAAIYAKMLTAAGTPTPIAQYTLPMALSDVDTYYQAGTIASALIGLSKTLAAKETHADEAKVAAGPNAAAVASVKEAAAPNTRSATPVTLRITAVASDSSYTALRAQLFRNGSRTADPQIVAYVREILGPPPIAIGVILTDARFVSLRQRISACIVLRAAGQPCAAGSLASSRP